MAKKPFGPDKPVLTRAELYKQKFKDAGALPEQYVKPRQQEGQVNVGAKGNKLKPPRKFK